MTISPGKDKRRKTSDTIPTVRVLVIGEQGIGKTTLIRMLGRSKSSKQDHNQHLYRMKMNALDKRFLPLAEQDKPQQNDSSSNLLKKIFNTSPKRQTSLVFNLELWEIPSSVIELMQDPHHFFPHIQEAHACICLVDSTKPKQSLERMIALRDAIEQYGGCKKLYSLVFHKYDIRATDFTTRAAKQSFARVQPLFYQYDTTAVTQPMRVCKAVYKVIDSFLDSELRRLSENQCLLRWPAMSNVTIDEFIRTGSPLRTSFEEVDLLSMFSGHISPPVSIPSPDMLECHPLSDSIPYKVEDINRLLEKCNCTINSIDSQDSAMDNCLQSLQENLINVCNESVEQLAQIQCRMSEIEKMDPAQQQEIRDRLNEMKSIVTESHVSCKRYADAKLLFGVPGLQKQRNLARSNPDSTNSPAKKTFFRNIGTPVHSTTPQHCTPVHSTTPHMEQLWSPVARASCVLNASTLSMEPVSRQLSL